MGVINEEIAFNEGFIEIGNIVLKYRDIYLNN
jgi:hypothetical protein